MGAEGDKKVFLQIRVNKGLKKDFEHACKKMDLTASQVLRAHMRDFVDRYVEEMEAQEKKASAKVKGDRK